MSTFQLSRARNIPGFESNISAFFWISDDSHDRNSLWKVLAHSLRLSLDALPLNSRVPSSNAIINSARKMTHQKHESLKMIDRPRRRERKLHSDSDEWHTNRNHCFSAFSTSSNFFYIYCFMHLILCQRHSRDENRMIFLTSY